MALESPLYDVGESAALSTISAREIAVLHGYFRNTCKKRLCGQFEMAISRGLWACGFPPAATNPDTINANEGRSATYRSGGEGGIRPLECGAL